MKRWFSQPCSYPAHGDCPAQRAFLDSAIDYFRTKYYNGKRTETYTTKWGWESTREVWLINEYYGSRKEELIDWCYKWGRDYQVLFINIFTNIL